MFADLMFYVFAAVLLLSALGVVLARNPISCVILLVMCFLNVAGLFILIGAEFLGLLLVMVYVGAIAVMFLFVLMTIDVGFAELKEGFTSYLPIGLLVGVVLAVELIIAAGGGLFSGHAAGVVATFGPGHDQNIVALGKIMFTDFLMPFEVSGMILLVAMIGAIVLTHRRRTDVRRQVIADQLDRRPEEAVRLVKVRPGQGA